MATERSDVDVYVVRDDDVERETSHSAAIDEICWSVADIEQVDRHGTGEWYFRWSFAYAQVVRDLTGGASRRLSAGKPRSTTSSAGC